MKKVLLLMAVALLSGGCFKEFSGINDDNELLARLSKGNGTWQVTKIEQWNALDANPNVSESFPENNFFYFYERSKIVFGELIRLDYGEYYEANTLSMEATVSAQKERVVFEGINVGDGVVYTVEKSGIRKMIWLRMENDQATRYYLEKCDCIVPINTQQENGG